MCILIKLANQRPLFYEYFLGKLCIVCVSSMCVSLYNHSSGVGSNFSMGGALYSFLYAYLTLTLISSYLIAWKDGGAPAPGVPLPTPLHRYIRTSKPSEIRGINTIYEILLSLSPNNSEEASLKTSEMNATYWLKNLQKHPITPLHIMYMYTHPIIVYPILHMTSQQRAWSTLPQGYYTHSVKARLWKQVI